MRKQQEITPDDSLVPVYLEEWSDGELAEVQAENERFTANAEGREKARRSALKKLEKLGLTVDEIKAVFE